MAIAIDKFVHIIDPTHAPVSTRQAAVVTTLIWVVSTLINVPYLMSYDLVDGAYYVPKDTAPFCGQFCDEINWHGETPRRLYGSAVVLLQVRSVDCTLNMIIPSKVWKVAEQ